MENTTLLEEQVKLMIIDRLNLELDPSSIDYDAAIFASFGDGLGLDSIDALEIVVGLNETFGVKVGDEDMAIFQSIRTVADYIREQKGE